LKIRYTAEAHRDLVDALDHGMRTDAAATAHLADRLLLVIERLAAGEFEAPFLLDPACTRDSPEHVESRPTTTPIAIAERSLLLKPAARNPRFPTSARPLSSTATSSPGASTVETEPGLRALRDAGVDSRPVAESSR
jgi:hypothetical protein